MTTPEPKARNVIVAHDNTDGISVKMANPRMVNWDLITRPGDLRGLVVDEWVITAMAAARMKQAGIFHEVEAALGASTITGKPVR